MQATVTDRSLMRRSHSAAQIVSSWFWLLSLPAVASTSNSHYRLREIEHHIFLSFVIAWSVTERSGFDVFAKANRSGPSRPYEPLVFVLAFCFPPKSQRSMAISFLTESAVCCQAGNGRGIQEEIKVLRVVSLVSASRLEFTLFSMRLLWEVLSSQI